MILHRQEKILLKKLRGAGKTKNVDELSQDAGERDAFRRAALWLQEKGLAEVEERAENAYRRSRECERFLEEGFPEVRVAGRGGKPIAELGDEEKRIGVMWAKKNGWIVIENGSIKAVKKPGEYALEKAARNPGGAGKNELDALVARGLLVQSGHRSTFISLTKRGEEVARGIGEIKEEIGELTHEMITGGKWKGAAFSPYAVAPAADEPIGKMHPLTRMTEKIRRIFLEMGFEEMEGPMLESSFWNFDALFQPQDHPARDLADTFYMEGKTGLPEKKLVERVKGSHEKGWKYAWSAEEAKRSVLRTHTTAVSARYLAKLDDALKNGGGKGKKYFCVGRVFRNEATDFKHLAEFHQVEGIVAWDGANFTHLLGLLKEFYRRLGFEKVRFRPSYFPYTEPSLEIEVFFERKGRGSGGGEWMELGGAGIFRPEMTKPLCGVYPVLAWGLSLERPMMLMEGLDDIRTFYKNDLEWLKGSRIGRDY
ncbi:MAG: phenylalanine--tRNA ligase subunit alpha [Candidatus ainarchaeum sp.]|nr:phenylalanine--tRNA ligase subunit alpha [Candidatus ainarchaeum sp.]